MSARQFAQIPELFARDVECVTRQRDRIARIIGKPAGETVASNQCIKISLCYFHTNQLLHWSKTTDLSLQLAAHYRSL